MNNLLVLQNFTIARKSGNILVCEKNVSAFSCNSEVLQYQQIIHLFLYYTLSATTDCLRVRNSRITVIELYFKSTNTCYLDANFHFQDGIRA